LLALWAGMVVVISNKAAIFIKFINLKRMYMKLKTFIAVAAIVLLTACSSSRYRASDTGILIPVEAQRAFDYQYPSSMNIVWASYDPNVVIVNDWELTGWSGIDRDDYEVRFDMDGEKYYAWYDRDGTWIGTAYVVNDFNTLPAEVRNTINMQYSTYTISKVNREFYKDKTVFEVVLKNPDNKMVLLIDPNGTIVKSKAKSL
jgi:hypothetical protein